MIHDATFEVAAALADAGIDYRVFGGVAVELALGRDLRPHDDLDLFVARPQADGALRVLDGRGFAPHAGSLDAGDVFVKRDDLLVDLVPLDVSADPPRAQGKLAGLTLPAGLWAAHRVEHPLGPVMTLPPAQQLALMPPVAAFFGGPPREKTEQDAAALRAFLAAHAAAGAADAVRVRRAVPADAEAACAALRRSIVECCVADHRNDPALLTPWLANKTPETVRGWYERENDYSVVAELRGEIVGVAALLAAGVVALCYLTPEARFHGVGRRMLAALEDEARRRGLAELTLTSTATGWPFYRRNGYTDEGPTRSHFGLAARAMRKRL